MSANEKAALKDSDFAFPDAPHRPRKTMPAVAGRHGVERSEKSGPELGS